MAEYRVWRQDDNGHRFLVASTTSAEEAERILASMERGHHKQIYWREAVASGSTPAELRVR